MNESAKISSGKIEKFLSKSHAFQKIDKGFYVVRQGSAYVYIMIVNWEADRSLVRFVAQLVRGVDMTPDLAMKLLRLNARMRFGAFGFVLDGACVTFGHTLLGGDTLDKEEVLATLRDLVLIADEYDDRILAEAGGQTMQQLLEESAIASLREHLEHKDWE